MEELLVVLEGCPNVKRLTYDPDKKMWLIEYRDKLSPDEVDSDTLIEFLDQT